MDIDFIRDFGILGAALIVLIGVVATTLKVAVPKLTEAWIKMKERQEEATLEERRALREAETEEGAAERQSQITLLSQVIQLTQTVIAQNKELLTFVTETSRSDMRELKTVAQQELHEIDSRWLATYREMQQGNGELKLLRMEITRLADHYRVLEDCLLALGIIQEIENGTENRGSSAENTSRA